MKKYRRQTTAESIQKTGREIAINRTDEKLLSGVQKDIKKGFYSVIAQGTGTATGKGLQAALAAAWGEVVKFYEDEDATPIYFVSSDDLSEYLGEAQITLQNAFGFSYVKDFLGLGTVVVSPSLTKGKLIATAKENLHCAYIPANSGDVAQTFGLTSDTTGLVGMTHSTKTDNATIDTLVMSGVQFYPEMLDGVIAATIIQPENADITDSLEDKEYTQDELSALTIEKIKGLAAFRGYTITKTTKDEIIQEFLAQQTGE